MLMFQKKVNESDDLKMKLVNVRSELMEVFEVTGFTDILTIE